MKDNGKEDLSFDSFLRKEGLYEEVVRRAGKKIMAEKLRRAMKSKNVTPSELARRMKTSRPQVYRLLDEKKDVTLGTLSTALDVLGYDLDFNMVKKRKVA
jgi:DNA-binding phage protein